MLKVSKSIISNEKRCEYCNKEKSFKEEANKSLFSKTFKNDVDVSIEIDKGRLYVSTENILIYRQTDWQQTEGVWCFTSKKINYCPMCGRRLQ